MKNRFSILILFLCTLFACEKKDLDKYAGPQGEQGNRGDQGAPGNGLDIVLKEFVVTPGDWSKNRYTLSIPELTKKYVDAGLAMVYVEQEGSWYPLPFKFYDSAFWNQNFQYMIGEGSVQLIHESGFVSPPLLSYQFKLVAAGEPEGSKVHFIDLLGNSDKTKLKTQ